MIEVIRRSQHEEPRVFRDEKTGVAATVENKSTRIAACDLCGEVDFETVGERDRKGNEFRTVVCKTCGLVSHASIPSDQELADYYRRQYRKEYHDEYTPSAYRFLREWKRGRRRFELLQPFLDSSERVFEIGSGIGCNLKPFELAGFNVAGIEPGEGFRKFAREKLRLQVDGYVLAEVPREPRHDLVLLIHVLEHFSSPTAALRHIHSILNPGGRLYVEVPNLGAPHAAPGKLFHFAHIYNFTPTSLSTAAGATGFVVDAVLSDPREKNLAMLLSATDCCKLEVAPDAYRNTVEAIARFNAITYHLRWQYLRERLLSIGDLLTGRFGAQKQVARILEASGKRETSSQPDHKAARARNSREGDDLKGASKSSRGRAA